MNLPSIQPVFAAIGEFSRPKRILICVSSLLLIVGIFGYLIIWPKWQSVGRLDQNLRQLQTQLSTARMQARQIEDFRTRMAEAEHDYRRAGQALPETQEIPSLLAGIAQAGHSYGLEFLLFEPKAEISRSFYAEIPVSITVRGNYHNIARFFDDVARLPRLVNIRDIRIAPPRPGEPLVTSCTAVTYKFIEEIPEPEAAPASRRGAGSRRTGAK